jgi:hypothetical protein
MNRTRRQLIRHAAVGALVSPLLGCAGLNRDTDTGDVGAEGLEHSDWAQLALGQQPAPWRHQTFPGKTPNSFRLQEHKGQPALAVRSQRSLSVMRKALDLDPASVSTLRFEWAADAPTPTADVGVREHDDSPLRIVLTFDGDRSTFTARNAALSELAQALTGEPMPYATLMYVWCPNRPLNEAVINPRTDRIRSVVVQTGAHSTRQWQTVERDTTKDFVRVFGEVPRRLVGIGLMTDTDNTQSQAQAWYGRMQLQLQRRG